MQIDKLKLNEIERWINSTEGKLTNQNFQLETLKNHALKIEDFEEWKNSTEEKFDNMTFQIETLQTGTNIDEVRKQFYFFLSHFTNKQ